MAKDIKKVKEHKKKKNGEKKKSDKDKLKSKNKKLKKNSHIKIVKEKVGTTKRKWVEKNEETGKKKEYIKGKITEDEEKKIENALCQYAYENNYSNDQLLSLITEKLTNDNKIWPKIAECLPNRSVQSVHNFCHRKYHPNNYKGAWSSQEEKDLLTLVKEHGKKWTLIASKMERTPTNVKDKYKELGGENKDLVTKDITLIKILKLLKSIRNYLVEEKEDEKYNFFRYVYKFSDKVDEKYENVFKLIKQDDNNNKITKFLIDSSIKEDKSNIIIKNALKKILNLDKLSSIVEDKVEIAWNIISKQLEFFSVDTCRNVFRKILNMFDIESIYGKKKDLLLVNKILDLDYENIDEINWEYIKAKRKPNENKERMEELLRHFDPFGVKSFKDVLLKIKDELEKELNNKGKKGKKGKNNDDSSSESDNEEDEKEFKEEIKEEIKIIL
jgi:hypothetical protein